MADEQKNNNKKTYYDVTARLRFTVPKDYEPAPNVAGEDNIGTSYAFEILEGYELDGPDGYVQVMEVLDEASVVVPKKRKAS